MIEDRTWEYLRKIPQKYQKSSGIRDHVFRINQPWHRPFRYALDNCGTIDAIPETASCYLRHGDDFTLVAVSRGGNPSLYHAILHMGAYLFAGSRVERYLTLYKGYEALGGKHQEDSAAVRHAVAHAAVALNRRGTVATLQKLFGTVHLNLEDYQHQRIFFQQMARLLISLDMELADKLTRYIAGEHKSHVYRALLHDWQAEALRSRNAEPQPERGCADWRPANGSPVSTP